MVFELLTKGLKKYSNYAPDQHVTPARLKIQLKAHVVARLNVREQP